MSKDGIVLTEIDVNIMANCNWETCTLCDSDRKERCVKIKSILKQNKEEELIKEIMFNRHPA